MVIPTFNVKIEDFFLPFFPKIQEKKFSSTSYIYDEYDLQCNFICNNKEPLINTLIE